jgi:asparagine N-glycosylation enzyme membrane subunit Stt3
MIEEGLASSDRERGPGFRELAAEALRYWEPRRLVYNIVLAGVVIFYFALAWPNSRAFISINAVLFLFILAVLANICYSAAYVVDVFVQLSSLRVLWLQRRWLLFVLGTMFGAVITRFFALAFFTGTP